MISPYCIANEHEVCTKRIRRQTGKLYSCQCSCHPKPVKVEKVIDDLEDDDDM